MNTCPICQKSLQSYKSLPDKLYCFSTQNNNNHVFDCSVTDENYWSLSYEQITIIHLDDAGINVFDQKIDGKEEHFIVGKAVPGPMIMELVRNYFLLK